MKKILIIIAIVIGAPIAYYLISPRFITIEVDDALPENTFMNNDAALLPSGFENLSEERQTEMLASMEDMNAIAIDEMKEEMPKTSVFVEKKFPVLGTSGHPAEGYIRIFATNDSNIIRYENFESINGPQLHVYLANDLEGNDFVDLGPIRGTKGNINYTVPENIDVSDYKYVMYWCVPFGVLFNYAEINL